MPSRGMEDILVTDIPEEVFERLKQQAALTNTTLEDYCRRLVVQDTMRPEDHTMPTSLLTNDREA